jgi:hypothetical protein
MKSLSRHCETFRSLAGLALAGMGLFLLFGRVIGEADRLSRTLDQTASAGMELVSWIMLASTVNAHRLEHALLTLLWPVIPGLVGTVLLWSSGSQQSNRRDGNQPCIRWA